MKKLIILSTLFLACISYSQEKFSIAQLSPKLLKKANSVVLDKSTKIVIDKYNSMTITEDKTIIILNKAGLSALDAYVFYNKSRKIKNLKARVYNALGEEVTSFKKKDFKDVSYVNSVNLYSDDRIRYLDYTPSSYPVTIRFQKELKTRNTAFIRDFRPYLNHYQSIKSTTFEIENNSGEELRSYENEFMGNVEVHSNSSQRMRYSINNQVAIPKEVYSPSLETFTPKVMFALQNFELERQKGEIVSWEAFGKWQYENLLKGTDELPKSTVSEIKSITENLETDREKAKAVYEYVQNNTRYISVQVGIGGWKPISAKEVDEKKYGDCKGLTNYTKALLKAVNIESNYCLVQAGTEIEDISHDFPSIQGNHVILNIPQENDDDIWLECTSQDIPFNFLGTFTDNRNVVAIKPSGGELLKTPVYSDDDNYQSTTSSIKIIDKALHADVKIETHGTRYDNRYSLSSYNHREIQSHYNSYWKNLKELTIKDYEFWNNKDDITFTEELNVLDENYAKVYGNDLILEVNPFNKFKIDLPTYSSRATPFVVERGFVDEDKYVFDIEGLTLATELNDITVDSEYGSYTLTFELQDDQLIVKRYLKLNKNQYQKADYADFVKFFTSIFNYDNTKLSFSMI